ncbi:TetR/AcrR family transcriptional regulator [Streptomyces bobili]|uniref:TetR/AcrR family transcriptional regulator n=1 Tax=Streptomyces bobili TaxID=67280 RepID=UPI00341E3F72
MRYAKGHKEETRRRILDAAGRRFKKDGIDGTGITALMVDAGLTNGAFYAHFSSKDDLVARAVADQLKTQRDGLDALPFGRDGVEQFVRHYLSAEHRDNPALGCPSAALLDEIGRCTDDTKQAYTEGLAAVMDAIGARLSTDGSQLSRPAMLAVFAMMVGAVQLSRALADRSLAGELLERAAADALRLLDNTGAEEG